ncbi:S1 family peptidase [Corynebacterium aquatimens]|uniref:Trypsin n=1 Tax=Corynebacterium aquatimens TaxID=1190508 RepID=A0A931DZE2_9CORY|nr:S1 family peptidase [Corynebacterium aquatimens]MBG6123242.1 hypothetical protein [Corynebacterium aquatimens]
MCTLAAATMMTGAVVSAPAAQAQNDPYYKWRTDPISKTMAGKPAAPGVLHRVPGSWFDANRVPDHVAHAAARGRAVYGPGAPILVGNGLCTVTVAGTDAAGRKVAITAAHCGGVGAPVVLADARQLGRTGTVAYRNEALDYAVIVLGRNADITNNYNGHAIRGVAAPPPPGARMCKNGFASGFTCGNAWFNRGVETISQVCAMGGDSGAPLFVGDRLVGMINGGILPPLLNLQCMTPLQGGFHAPTATVQFGPVLADLNSQRVPGSGFRFA